MDWGLQNIKDIIGLIENSFSILLIIITLIALLVAYFKKISDSARAHSKKILTFPYENWDLLLKKI